jgi:hypothetical protein
MFMDKLSSLRIVSLGCRFKNEYIHSNQAIFYVLSNLWITPSLSIKLKARTFNLCLVSPKLRSKRRSKYFSNCFLLLSSFQFFDQVWYSKYRCNVCRGILYILKACTWLQSSFLMQIIARDISSGSHCWRLHSHAVDLLFFCNECAKLFINSYFVSEIVLRTLLNGFRNM